MNDIGNGKLRGWGAEVDWGQHRFSVSREEHELSRFDVLCVALSEHGARYICMDALTQARSMKEDRQMRWVG